MNLTAAIMLVNKAVRPLRVEYDPDYAAKNTHNRLFKTLDPEIKVGDFIIVPTSTRHGMTVVKVMEMDFAVNFDSPIDYFWVYGKVDKTTVDMLLEQEAQVVSRINQAEENRKRKELMEAMGLANVDLTDLDIVRGTVAAPALASPRGTGVPEGSADIEAPPVREDLTPL